MSDNNIIQLPLKMPAELVAQVQRLGRPPDPQYADLTPLEPVHDLAAVDWLQRKRKQLQPGTCEDCHAWLAMLALGVNAITEDVVEARGIAVWERCEALPALVWCKATRQIMQDSTPHLPTPGEVYAVLAAYVAPLIAEIAALERIAAAPKLREVRLPAYEIPPAPDWTKSRHLGRAGIGYAPDDTSESASSLGAAVRRVQADLAARKPASGAEPQTPPVAG